MSIHSAVSPADLSSVSAALKLRFLEDQQEQTKPPLHAVAAVLAQIVASILCKEANPTNAERDARAGSGLNLKGCRNGVLERPKETLRSLELAFLGAPTNVSEARMDYDLARDTRRRAQEELLAAIKSGDPQRIRAAQANLRGAEMAESAALETYNRMVQEADVEKKRLTKEGADRISRALQHQATERGRVADLQCRARAAACQVTEVPLDGVAIKTTRGSNHRLVAADSEVSTARFQFVNDVRNAA